MSKTLRTQAQNLSAQMDHAAAGIAEIEAATSHAKSTTIISLLIGILFGILALG